MTTYGVKVNRVNFTIAVVYLVPDADTAAVTAVYRKLIESENKYENFMAMGDFNLDFKTDSVKKKNCGTPGWQTTASSQQNNKKK